MPKKEEEENKNSEGEEEEEEEEEEVEEEEEEDVNNVNLKDFYDGKYVSELLSSNCVRVLTCVLCIVS